MATAGDNNHWLVGTSIPVIMAALGVAVSAGIVYNNIGRILILEAELTLRNNILPAQTSAERIKRLEDTTQGLPVRDSQLAQQVESLQRDVSRLNSIAERAVIEWNDIKSRVSRMEATVESMQERERRLRDDLNAHREADEALLRDRLRAPPSAITTSPR